MKKKISNPSRTTKLEEHVIAQDERIKAIEIRVKELESWRSKLSESLAAVERALSIKTIDDEPTQGEQRGVKYGD